MFGWDFLGRMTTESDDRNQVAKAVLDGSYDDSKLSKQQALMRRYMERRANVSKV